MLAREILGSGRNCIGNFSLWWTCMEHGCILYMFVKRRLRCVQITSMELLCMCLEIIPECVLKLVRGLYLNQSTRHSTLWTQVVVKVGDVFFSASVIKCLHLLHIPWACMSWWTRVLLFIHKWHAAALPFFSSIQIYFPYFACNIIVLWSVEYRVY